MNVYEIPNINNCTVEEIGNPAVMYRIRANDGWYIHLNDGDEETANFYKKTVALLATYPFEQVEIVAEADLPADAEIYGNNTSEVM